MKIKVFSHMAPFDGGRQIAEEQLELLSSSGLIENAEIYLFMNYDQGHDYDWLRDKIKGRQNIGLIQTDAIPKEFEIPTLKYIKDMCDRTDDEFAVLYIHHKGITWINNPNFQNVVDWRHYMEHFNITKWRDCVIRLEEGYDTVGVNWMEAPIVDHPHYSGNFWWSKASYIRKLPPFKRPHAIDYKCQYLPQDEENVRYRMEAELWLDLAKPNAFCMHHSMRDHYWFPYPPSEYM